jgi:1,4-alpha-glucan branching enzyme
VSVVGDFNAWNPSATPLRRAPNGGAWVADVPIPPGRHVYAFIVDGVLVVDPGAPRAGDEDFGVPSSVVIVRGAET